MPYPDEYQCHVCGEPVLMDCCKCGFSDDRLGKTFMALMRGSELSGALEQAARRWLDDRSDEGLDALEDALREWVDERSKYGRYQGGPVDFGRVGHGDSVRNRWGARRR